MFKDILAGLQQQQPQQQGFNPMMPQQPMMQMPAQMPQQPVMTDPWGQQTSGIKAALMGRMMR